MESSSSSLSSSVIITPEDVLESLMSDGTIDAIRLKIINQLKANEELKNTTINMVDQSQVLNTPGVEKQTKREMFDALRQELEIPALERASKSVWELILDDRGLGKEINETVERVFCQLSGQKPPLFPSSDNVLQQEKQVKENDNLRKEQESEQRNSSSKKRNLSKMNVEIEQGEVAQGSGKKAVSESRRCKRTDGRSWRCSKERAPNEKFCEKHIYKAKKAKKQVESKNEGTASPKISSSTPSKFIPDDSDNNRSRHRNGKSSTRLASSPKGDIESDIISGERVSAFQYYIYNPSAEESVASPDLPRNNYPWNTALVFYPFYKRVHGQLNPFKMSIFSLETRECASHRLELDPTIEESTWVS